MVKIKFEVIDLEEQINIISNFLSYESDISNIIASHFGFNLKELLNIPQIERENRIRKFQKNITNV